MNFRNFIKEIVGSFIHQNLPRSVFNFCLRNYEPHAQLSFSQDGEDLVLRSLLIDVQVDDQFYVDIGAHHPQRFSNTYSFYLAGWSGINVDATPGSMKPFLGDRPRDINLELAISDQKGELEFFLFNEPALNGFSRELSMLRDSDTGNPYKIIGTVRIPALTMEEMLAKYLPPGRQIAFLTIDVEGHDLAILKTNDWNRYRPTFILAEELDSSGSLEQYLLSLGYHRVAQTKRTSIFKDR